jgi:uncharacterized protein
MNSEEETSYVRIPADRLPSDVLEGILAEFVLREGTDYGSDNGNGSEHSLSEKVEQVRGQLAKGVVAIVYDPKHESCTVVEAWKLGREES